MKSVTQSMQPLTQPFFQNQFTLAQPQAPPVPPTPQLRSNFYRQNITSPQVQVI